MNRFVSSLSDFGQDGDYVDLDVGLGLAYANQSGHAYLNTSKANDADAALMVRLLKTRRNNKAARAYAGLEANK